jgi:hypothetical protein
MSITLLVFFLVIIIIFIVVCALGSILVPSSRNVSRDYWTMVCTSMSMIIAGRVFPGMAPSQDDGQIESGAMENPQPANRAQDFGRDAVVF